VVSPLSISLYASAPSKGPALAGAAHHGAGLLIDYLLIRRFGLMGAG